MYDRQGGDPGKLAGAPVQVASQFQFLDWLPGQPKARMTSASAATAPSITVSLMLP
jgi:hypothetical protein